MRKHEYDGIQELDNDMPKWWVNLFLVTIVFSALYLMWYHLPFFPSLSLIDEYALAAKTSAEAAQKQRSLQSSDAYDYAAAVKDPSFVAKGKETFLATCAACHANDGGGGVGPNLTDQFWLHGGAPDKIEHTVLAGVAEKGMPAWESVLGTDKVREVVGFILTLKGTKPLTPKQPQGVDENSP